MSKYQYIFDTSDLKDDIKRRSLRSGAITLTSQALQFVIQLGSTMILARILAPADYGINAMAVAITGFANMFSNLGLSTATIQRAEITHEQVSLLFWINAGIGLILTFIVASLSPVVAWFYKTPEMLSVMLALSSMFVINGLAAQHYALLTRQMRFLAIAIIQISALICGIIVAIIAAKNGFGYWSLIFNSLTNVSVYVLGNWIACRWVPCLPRRNVGVGSMVKFGSHIAGFDIINYFARNLDNILIGRYYGSGALGLYSKAYQLLMMPITNLRDPMTRVAMPALSRLQSDPVQYREYYLKCISLLAFVSMPLVVFMFVCSDQLIDLLLGTQWLGASKLFKILAIAAFLQPVTSTTGMVLLSTGRSRLYFVLGTVSAALTCISFLIGLQWGATGVAISYAIVNYLLLFPGLYYVFNGTSITVNDFIRTISKPLFASLAMGGGCFLILVFSVGMNTIVALSVCFIASAALYLLLFAAFSSGIGELKNYISYVKLIFEKK